MRLGREPGPSDARLPDFLIIGATKCGTESLHRYLTSHPEVFMHPTKEIRYFSAGHNWERGLDWYRSQFSAAGAARAVGESSNSYTRYPVYGGVPERIRGILPGVRMVYLIRHPIRRIESHYRHRLVMGREWRGAEEAVKADPSYVAASRYGDQLEQYLRYFPGEQILVLRLERLLSDPAASLRRLSRFLGVGELPGVGFPRVNVTSERAVTPAFLRYFARFPAARGRVRAASQLYRQARLDRFSSRADRPTFTLSQSTHDELTATFREDRALLARLLGESFDDWDL